MVAPQLRRSRTVRETRKNTDAPSTDHVHVYSDYSTTVPFVKHFFVLKSMQLWLKLMADLCVPIRGVGCEADHVWPNHYRV
jgi:hypothetical protein